MRVLCTTTTKMMEPTVPQDCDALLVTTSLEEATAQVAAAFSGVSQRVVLAAGYAEAHRGLSKGGDGVVATGPGKVGGGGGGARGPRRIDGIPPAWPRQLLAAGCCDAGVTTDYQMPTQISHPAAYFCLVFVHVMLMLWV